MEGHTGKMWKAVITLDGDTFTQVQILGDDVITTIRNFTDEECICTYRYKDVVCTRWHKVVD
jgi:hypothetical protein